MQEKKSMAASTAIAAIGQEQLKWAFLFPENQTTEFINSSSEKKKKIKSSSMFSKNTMKQRPEESDGILQSIHQRR